MHSLSTPPSSPILKGAGRFDIECQPCEILALDASPPSPTLKGAEQESCIWVTRGVDITSEVKAAHKVGVKYEVEVTHETEQKYEQIPLDIDQLFRTPLSNNPWNLCYVATDEFEAEDSDWCKIASTPGIYVLGKRFDGFYEVVIDESYIPWLLYHKFRFLDKVRFKSQLRYDPTQIIEIAVKVYGVGVWEARRISYVCFLENAFRAIWSRRSLGLELCLRSIAPSDLQTALEWAILNRDILASGPLVRKKFTLCLVLLALILHKDYSTPLSIQLLEKDEEGVLQAFGKAPMDLFRAATAEYQNREADLHFIGLVRRLAILSGVLEDIHQLKFELEYTAIENLNLFGSLVGVTGSNHFRNLDLNTIHGALSRSKAITGECIEPFHIAELINQLMIFFRIGFQPDMGLPTKAPVQLPLRHMKVSDITILGDGLYELEKGFTNRKLGNGDVVKLRLGGVMTGSTSQKFTGDANMRLPSPLEEIRLVTLFVDYDGWYEDNEGTHRLANEVLKAVQTMTIGQKVLIIEEKDRNPEKHKDNREKETLIWVVQVLQVLQVCAGHFSFGQNVPVQRTIGENPKRMNKSVRQRIRNKLGDPRVECSACGLGRIFSSICCKFLGKPSNCAYVAL